MSSRRVSIGFQGILLGDVKMPIRRHRTTGCGSAVCCAESTQSCERIRKLTAELLRAREKAFDLEFSAHLGCEFYAAKIN